ncbi:MAG: hypothetical protein CM15mP74_00130 [Halieaceae bacterium]|nr:MAG: hypothetical protein CM15mP74_00130 [Halieaceae bacterium]
MPCSRQPKEPPKGQASGIFDNEGNLKTTMKVVDKGERRQSLVGWGPNDHF